MARPPNPDTHDALLEAARHEFARNGLARARVEDITRRAGVSKGAFYLHFRTKEDALEELLQRFMGALEEFARRRREAEVAGDAASGARERELEARFDVELLEIFWRNRLVLAAVERSGAPGYSRALSEFRRRMRALVSTRVHERQKAGALRGDVAPEILATAIVGAYEGFGRRMIELREKPDIAMWARGLIAILYEGILARSPTAAARRPRGARPS